MKTRKICLYSILALVRFKSKNQKINLQEELMKKLQNSKELEEIYTKMEEEIKTIKYCASEFVFFVLKYFLNSVFVFF